MKINKEKSCEYRNRYLSIFQFMLSILPILLIHSKQREIQVYCLLNNSPCYSAPNTITKQNDYISKTEETEVARNDVTVPEVLKCLPLLNM